jgi:hypothetical protein
MKRTEKKKHDLDDREFLVDLLFETSLSISDIAKELNWTINEVNKTINKIGLGWLKDSRKKMSKGQSALTQIVQKLIPKETIINEYHIGNKLKLDIYCPKYRIAAEYHGRQHFYYTQRFFESKYEFIEAQKRDQKKVEWCKQNGITLVVFRYNDRLTEDAVFDRIISAIKSTPHSDIKKEKKSIAQNIFYKNAKKRNAEFRKKIYKSMKEKKNANRKTKRN